MQDIRALLEQAPSQTRHVQQRGIPRTAAEIGACLLHFVTSGRLRLYHASPTGQEMTLALRRPLSCFSLAWLDPRGQASTFAMAITAAAEVVSLSEAQLQALCTEYPELGHVTCVHAMRLLGDAYARLADLALYDVPTRLAHVLGALAYAEPGPITATHQELGWRAGATRPRVTQALRHLRQLGLIAYAPHRRGIRCLTRTGCEMPRMSSAAHRQSGRRCMVGSKDWDRA